MKTGLLLITLLLALASCAPTPGQPETTPGATIASQASLPSPDYPSATVRPADDNLKKPGQISSTVTSSAEIDLDTLAVITASNVSQLERLITLTGHTNRVTDLVFSADGKNLASAGRDRNIRLWEIKSGKELYAFPIRESDLNVIAFSPDGSLLASAEAIWDVESKEKIQPLEQNPVAPGHVAFSPDGAQLIIAGFHQTVKLLDVATGKVQINFDPPQGVLGVFNIEFSPDGKLAAAGGNQGILSMWDVQTGSLLPGLQSNYHGDLHGIAFSPDGKWLAAGGSDEVATIWNIKSGEAIKVLPLGNGIYNLTVSPDGSLLATAGCDRTVKLWDVASWKLLRSLPHGDELMAVAFSQDSKLLAAGGYDNTIVVWGISERPK